MSDKIKWRDAKDLRDRIAALEASLKAAEARADALAEKLAEMTRRRDAWERRAEGHVEMVNALKAKTAGQDSRTLSRSLLGAAFNQCEAERDALAEKLERAVKALHGLVDALDAVDAEAERADQPGATAWSSAPVVALRYKRQEASATLAALEDKKDG